MAHELEMFAALLVSVCIFSAMNGFVETAYRLKPPRKQWLITLAVSIVVTVIVVAFWVFWINKLFGPEYLPLLAAWSATVFVLAAANRLVVRAYQRKVSWKQGLIIAAGLTVLIVPIAVFWEMWLHAALGR